MDEGWLIYCREDWQKNRAYADRLIERSCAHGMNLRLVLREELDDTGVAFDCAPRFAVNRSRDWQLAQALEQAGCMVTNSSKACRIGNDKVESHRLAARLGLPQVDIAFCANNPDELSAHGLGYPVVLKDPYGHGGTGVFLAHNREELLSMAAILHCSLVLLQRLCGMPGVDLRVYVLGGEVLAAVRRQSATDFRANLSLGGTVELCEPGLRELEMVRAITTALPLDYAGIDFIYDSPDQPLLNEIEDAVGSRSLYQLGGPDTAEAYIALLARKMM